MERLLVAGQRSHRELIGVRAPFYTRRAGRQGSMAATAPLPASH